MKSTVKQEPVYFEHHYYFEPEPVEPPVEKKKRVVKVKSRDNIVKAYAEKHGFAGVHGKPWTPEDSAKLNAILRKAGYQEV